MGSEDAPASDEIPLKNGIYRGDTTEMDNPNGGTTRVAFLNSNVHLGLNLSALLGAARKRQYRVLRHAPAGRERQELHRRLEVREEVRLREDVLVVGG